MKHHIHSQRELDEKRNWYSSAATEYDNFRPKYPNEIIQRTCEIAKLAPNANLLEIGAGPATATLLFAKRGYQIVSLEPSKSLYRLAKKNCRPFANVEMINTTFEEWKLQEESFDAVFAPTSIHWVSSEIAYSKSSRALKPNGYFILLWNMPLRPSLDVHRVFGEIYEEICPSMYQFHDNNDLRNQIKELGENLKNSEFFGPVHYEDMEFNLIYSGSEYVQYLNTMSNYLKLEENVKSKLYNALKDKISRDFGGKIKLYGLSALQISQKNNSS